MCSALCVVRYVWIVCYVRLVAVFRRVVRCVRVLRVVVCVVCCVLCVVYVGVCCVVFVV